MASALTNNELSTYLQVLTLLRQRQRAQQAQHARTHQLLEQILTAVAEQQHAIHATIHLGRTPTSVRESSQFSAKRQPSVAHAPLHQDLPCHADPVRRDRVPVGAKGGDLSLAPSTVRRFTLKVSHAMVVAFAPDLGTIWGSQADRQHPPRTGRQPRALQPPRSWCAILPCPVFPVLCVDTCLLYTSDAADEEDSVDLGGRRIIKKKKEERNKENTLEHNI
eukprot:TRINITY_DN2513_c0_g1_i1.p1 TRINITY_DN2513_c0_g1~~TRINITY_DN2513_c0_g1_i1.p1  ORF type:complete len:221 (-),score=10.69 TRINITY_DN2513_c0_g1_i1:15-677(-)